MCVCIVAKYIPCMFCTSSKSRLNYCSTLQAFHAFSSLHPTQLCLFCTFLLWFSIHWLTNSIYCVWTCTWPGSCGSIGVMCWFNLKVVNLYIFSWYTTVKCYSIGLVHPPKLFYNYCILCVTYNKNSSTNYCGILDYTHVDSRIVAKIEQLCNPWPLSSLCNCPTYSGLHFCFLIICVVLV